jgi:hypothetical protein
MAASAILLAVVAYDSRVALVLSRRDLYALALLDDKMQGMDSVALYGHWRRVCPDTVGVLVKAFAAAIGQVLSELVKFGRLIPRGF